LNKHYLPSIEKRTPDPLNCLAQVFSCVNGPLRDVERRARGDAHPLPVTVTHLTTGIKKLRTIPAQDYAGLRASRNLARNPVTGSGWAAQDYAQAAVRRDFYRGISNATILEQFLLEGGTELALMSTTREPRIALKYALRGRRAVLLRLRVSSCMEIGADLAWLSCFPHEEEFVYPPITFLRPITGKKDEFVIGDSTVTVVDVEPKIA
jgi:hypothetical protein